MKIDDLKFLKSGSGIQQKAYKALEGTNVLSVLSDYNPLLTGTVPIDLCVEGSDLDIICEASDLDRFFAFIKASFSSYEGYTAYKSLLNGKESVVAKFNAYDFPFEIFCEDRKRKEQEAYVHLEVEKRLLTLTDASTKEQIRALKASGIKTEPAFASAFNIKGDAYQELYDMYIMSDEEIRAKLHI